MRLLLLGSSLESMKGSDRSATALEAPPDHDAGKPSDAALGAALHAGDQAALASLYDRHMPAIYDFLARYLRDPSTAEDLAQNTFLRAWERRETLSEPGGVRAWLFTIAHNLATNQLTRSRKADPIEERFDLAAPGPGPEQQAASNEAAELVWAAASSLEPRQYAVLDLCLRRDLSTREVADVMDIPVGHAAVLVNRAREALGNAVRYLLVAHRREHCEGLAALVPAGVRALTPQQRSAVDHHMRRCEACRSLGRRLTTPAELFGGLVALPVPESLAGDRRDYVLTSAQRQQAQPSGPGALRGRPANWSIVLGGLALLALATIAVVAHGQKPGGSPAQSPAAAPSSAAAVPAQPGSPAPPTGVNGVKLSADDSLADGCPQTPAGYRCSFTVVVDLDRTGAGSRLSGGLTATAQGPGGSAQTRTADFAADVPAGARAVFLPVSVFFDVPPCASQDGSSQSSTAVAATAAPEAVTSTTTPFGVSCFDPAPAPSAGPPSQTGAPAANPAPTVPGGTTAATPTPRTVTGRSTPSATPPPTSPHPTSRYRTGR
jgi:RNA polymerase sigma factor (sigma-70 family)